MFENGKIGLAAVAAMLVGIPFATGCGDKTSFQLEDTTSRMAYTVNDPLSPNSAASEAGSDAATVVVTPDSAGFETPSDGVRNQNNLVRNPGGDNANQLFAGKSYTGTNVDGGPAEIYVGDTMTVGGEDVFLSVHDNVVGTTRKERALAYTGNRTSIDTIDQLRGRDSHQATYTGAGRITGNTGPANLAVDGTLEMTVNFTGGDADVTGRMDFTTPQGPDNGNGLTSMTFDGAFADGSADYSINNIKIQKNDADYVELDKQSGVGSFFGTNAGGTVGVFAGSGRTLDAFPSDVNVNGYFVGSTTDNDPPH